MINLVFKAYLDNLDVIEYHLDIIKCPQDIMRWCQTSFWNQFGYQGVIKSPQDIIQSILDAISQSQNLFLDLICYGGVIDSSHNDLNFASKCHDYVPFTKGCHRIPSGHQKFPRDVIRWCQISHSQPVLLPGSYIIPSR